MIKRLILIFLTAAMLLSSAPIAFADSTGAASPEITNAKPTLEPPPEHSMMGDHSNSFVTTEPTPEPTSEPTPEATPVPEAESAQSSEPTPEPAAQPEPVQAEAPEGELLTDEDFEADPEEDVSAITIDDVTGAVELEKGLRGDAVKQLQSYLIQKGYLSGAVDGIYGDLTVDAVTLFQYLNDLPVTGIADIAMQTLLYSDECPEGIDFPTLDFEAALNDPDSVEGMLLHFNGRVLQVIVDSKVALRVASRGAYEDVVYVTCEPTESIGSLKEGSRVAIYGTMNGTYTYTTVKGKVVVLPYIEADIITLQ